jgi:hypothetical protein
MANASLWEFPTGVGNERTDLRGMSVAAVDGGIGKIEDVIEEAVGSSLLIDTGPWIFGKKVLLPAGLVQGIDVDAETVTVDRTKEEIRAAPEYDEHLRRDPSYQEALERHYGAG